MLKTCLIILVLNLLVSAQVIDLCGTVKNSNGDALPNVDVFLEGQNAHTVTDSKGYYHFQLLPVVHGISSPSGVNFRIKNGIMSFALSKQAPVSVDLFGINGKRIGGAVERVFSEGTHNVALPIMVSSAALNVLRVKIGSTVSLYKYVPDLGIVKPCVKTGRNDSRLFKTALSADTLRASKAGYKTERISVSQLKGTADVILDSLENSGIGSNPVDDGSGDRLKQYGQAQYFWGELGNGSFEPIVRITHAVSADAVDIEITFNPHFVDNTYGTGSSIGWPHKRGHTFNDLVGSDHVELSVVNGDGDTVFYGKLDLISPSEQAVSGYACLGPLGGDGEIKIGDPSTIISFGGSLDDNLNYYGYSDMTVNSPQTDSTYSVNPDYPYWQYYVQYRLTLDIDIFGNSGYGEVRMTSVHASPAKEDKETIIVEDGPPPEREVDNPFRFLPPTNITIPDPPDTTFVPPA